MLQYKVYTNVMYMMHHRGMEEADDILKEISKEDPLTFMFKPYYHNIGYDFKSHIKSDNKEFEDRLMMSFCLSNEVNKEKQFVFFGINNKAFIDYLSTIIMKTSFDDYKCSYTLVIPKDFNSRFKSKVNIISSQVPLTIFMDDELIKPPFHAFGAKYELMTDLEYATLLKEIHISRVEMKKISSKDPIIKYYGFPPGKCVRIIQTPMITGSLLMETLDYRLIERVH